MSLNDCCNAIGVSRWDSEYYLKEFLRLNELINRKEITFLESYCNFLKKGIFDLSPDNYNEVGVPFIRTSEIKNPIIDFSSTVYIDELTHFDNSSTILYPNDIVFTKIGANIGDVSLLPDMYPQYNFSQNVAGASIIDKKNSAYLLCFLLSKYGKFQIQRSVMLSGQGKLELNDIRHYKIPCLSTEFKSLISHCLDKVNDMRCDSVSLYDTANLYLYNQIGIYNSNLSKSNFAYKRFSTFLKCGRLDAEYYQPKYDELFDKLKSFETKLLSEIVDIKKSIEPGSDAYQTSGIPFIRVADLSKFGLTTTDTYLSRDEYDGVIRPKKDTILLSKDGSVGIAYKIEEDTDVITSGAILHLIIKDDSVKPDYLTLVLNSIVVKMQAERDAGGSVIQHWKPSEIENVVIPILSDNIQKQITENIRESFALRARSQQLLELAKTAVEIAIEQGEDRAMELLTQNM